jgi:hypothetical protein
VASTRCACDLLPEISVRPATRNQPITIMLTETQVTRCAEKAPSAPQGLRGTKATWQIIAQRASERAGARQGCRLHRA